ncbi:MAG: hypothetical protein KatS3mg102_0656 [Planctomycetota bacterium]|nr:MAG: hypothetical protein KatS3mg102_0656 [Planctomycetota bacterium]
MIAYEPEPHNHAELQHNTAVFPHVVTVRAAVAGSSGQLVLYRARSSVSHSLYQRAEADASAACEPVQAISLDELFAEHQIERCDLLKLDIEGAEYEVIYGASERTLARVARLAAEYHDPRPDDPAARGRALADYLHQHGFAVRLVPRPRHRNKGRLYAVRAGAG